LVSKSGLAGFWRLGWIEKIFIGVVVYYVMNRSINFHDLWGPFDQGLIFFSGGQRAEPKPAKAGSKCGHEVILVEL